MAEPEDAPFGPDFSPWEDPRKRFYPIKEPLKVLPGTTIASPIDPTAPIKTDRGYPYDPGQSGAMGENGRPRAATAGISDMLAPFTGAYDMGQLGAGIVDNATQGKAGPVIHDLGLAAAGMIVPGARRSLKPFEPGPSRGLDVANTPTKPGPAGFYSDQEFKLDAMANFGRQEGSTAEWLKEFARAGIKPAEMDATGMTAYLRSKGHHALADLREFATKNRIEVQETRYGAGKLDDGPEYQAAKEKLLTERAALEQSIGGKHFSAWSKADIETSRKVNAIDKELAWLDKKHIKSAGDIRWKRAGGQNLLLDPDNPSNAEVVLSAPLPRQSLEVGEMLPFGAPGTDAAHYNVPRERWGQAMWNGHPIDGVTEASFKIGSEQGTIKYWPDTLGGAKDATGQWERTGPRFIVNSTNFQNAHFRTLDEAKAAIEKSYNDDPNSGMYRSRQDRYQEAHFPNVPGSYLAHLRMGKYMGKDGLEVLHGDELQATGAQKVRDNPGGARDEKKIAELSQRIVDSNSEKRAAYQEAQDWLKNYGVKVDEGWGEIGTWEAMSRVHNDTKPGTKTASGESPIEKAFMWMNKVGKIDENLKLQNAEFQAAARAPVGHPLTNDMGRANLLMVRKMLLEARDSGVPGITLTPGDLQNQRYNLEHHVDKLLYNERSGSLEGYDANGGLKVQQTVERGDLSGLVGIELAAKLTGRPADKHGFRVIEGPDMKVGGAGMRTYYDETYPNVFDKEMQRIEREQLSRDLAAAKTPEERAAIHAQEKYRGHGQTTVWNQGRDGSRQNMMDPDGPGMHYFKLTERIKKALERGLPLFSGFGIAGTAITSQALKDEEDSPFGPAL